MRTVLAAVDASPSAQAVVLAAIRMGELTGAAVEAVHVADGAARVPTSVAATAGVPLRVVAGPIDPALLDAFGAPDVIAAVIGGRGAGSSSRLAEDSALRVLERTSKPVVVVPPGASLRPFRRLLVPLEGTKESSGAVVERLAPLLVDDAELVVLHVFTEGTVPRMLDRPYRDFALLGDEFLARNLPGATDIRLCAGSVGAKVVEQCTAQGVDLVVLSWSQDSSAGRAEIIREVLERAPIPVLLLPLPGSGPR
jgi:hypothetical protein